MTRKRFIRLVMAEGIQRNQAEEIGERLMLTCQSWEQAYIRFELVKGHLPDLTIRFDDILSFSAQKIIQAIQKLSDALRRLSLNLEPISRLKEADHDPGD